MDFKQLESFVAAVDEGSFSNAAERLQLSQSMVTIHIRNLESELGTRLLNRTTRSMELSPSGRTFYSYARQMLKLNRDSIFALSRANQEVRAINIITTPYIVRYYLTNRIIEFNRRFPEVSFDFITCAHSEILNRLQSESAEFAFCTMKLMNSDYAVKHCDMANLVV
ncbi:MAG: LysR family transcriptional regulator, partial [Eubacteriales bacterium]